MTFDTLEIRSQKYEFLFWGSLHRITSVCNFIKYFLQRRIKITYLYIGILLKSANQTLKTKQT